MINCMSKNIVFLFVCALMSAQALPLLAQDGPANNEKEYQRQYQERIKKDRLFGIYIPKNLDDALVQLDKLLPPKKQAEIMFMPEDSVCRVLHNSLGRRIVDNWGFYGGSRFSHYLKSAGVTFPDDMADLVMLAYHRKINAKPIDLKGLIKFFEDKREKERQEELKKGKIIKEEKVKKG